MSDQDPTPAPDLSIATYGGERYGDLRTVQHWVLALDGRFLADTSVPEEHERWKRLVEWVESTAYQLNEFASSDSSDTEPRITSN